MSQSVESYKEFFEKDIVPQSWKDRVWDKADFKKFHESTVINKEAIEKW